MHHLFDDHMIEQSQVLDPGPAFCYLAGTYLIEADNIFLSIAREVSKSSYFIY